MTTFKRPSMRSTSRGVQGVRPARQSATVLAIAAGALVLLASCQATPPSKTPEATVPLLPTLVDQSLLTGAPCSPPCWYGLEPGRSTQDDAARAIETIAFVDPATVAMHEGSWVDGQPATFMTFDCRAPVSRRCGTLAFVDRTLVQVTIPTLYDLTFGLAVASLGAPDYFLVAPLHVQVPDCVVGLAWEDLGFLLVSDTILGEGCDTLRTVGRPLEDEPVMQAVYGVPGTVPSHGGTTFNWAGFSSR